MIIEKIEHIQRYTDITVQSHFAQLEPLIETVRDRYILPYIPEELYITIDTIAEPDPGDASLNAKMLFRLRAAIACFILSLYVPRSEAKFGANGLFRNEGENDKTPFRYQSASIEKSYFGSGISHLDRFLKLITDNSASIPEWRDSGHYEKYAGLLIKSGTELNHLYALTSPNITFMAITSDIEDAERLVLNKQFGSTFSSIKNDLVTSTPILGRKMDLLNIFKKILAYSSIYRGLLKFTLRLDGDSIMAINQDMGYQDRGDKPGDKKSYYDLVESLINTVQEYTVSAIELLNANPADFPEWNQDNNEIDNSNYSGLVIL